MLTYEELADMTNKINGVNCEFVPIELKGGTEALRSCWSKQLQPSVFKFPMLVTSNPPSSGQFKDDENMDLYYSYIRKMYTE